VGFVTLIVGASSARAQTVAVGPYYATPSWDQTLVCTAAATCPRFVVLSNLNNDAVLDRETGLVWEKAPSTAQVTLNGAQGRCLNLKTGGRMGWRLPKSDELFSLLDPTQTNNLLGGPSALPVGHPFVGTGGNTDYWTIDQDAPPFNNNLSLIHVFTNAGEFNTDDYNYSNARAWCVRGPGGAQVSP
jgi:hypothetical protein